MISEEILGNLLDGMGVNDPGKKVWIKLDRNVSIQFNTVFENYVSIQKNIKEVKETDWNKSTYQIVIKT